MAPPLQIQSGSLIAHRLLDVADGIDLARVEALWQAGAGRECRRTPLSTAAMALDVPPVALTLPAQSLELDGESIPIEMTARIYDFGAIVFALRMPVDGVSWAELVARCNLLERAVGPASGAAIWRDASQQILAAIGPALRRPAQRQLEEDYLFAVVHRFETPLTGAQVREQADLAALLSGETDPLSPQERAELTAQAFSYFVDDLVVLTWDRAFLYEPRRDADAIDIIEVANAQLLEMRYYDELLDAELHTMYDLVGSTRRGLSLLASRRAARLARRLYGMFAEVTELTEKVENALQVTQDAYLARVYGAALELFRVPHLSAAVDRKLAIIRDTYTALYTEASSRRAELLEAAIVLLIVFEIVVALVLNR